ncbi:MAG: hypothetical protein HY897_15905 [Deltaproteobacteria bacterium]|nr:hypothetical protein [Deltaproteobacteria bacterium]
MRKGITACAWAGFVVAAIFVASACNNAADSSGCSQDRDCEGGKVCIQGVCRAPGLGPFRDGGGARDEGTEDEGTTDDGPAGDAGDTVGPDAALAPEAGSDGSDPSDSSYPSDASDASPDGPGDGSETGDTGSPDAGSDAGGIPPKTCGRPDPYPQPDMTPEDPAFVIPPEFCQSGVFLRFDSQNGYALTPFPNNFYTEYDADTSTCMRLAFEGRIGPNEGTFTTYPETRAQLEALEGFSTSSRISFIASDQLENSYLVPGSLKYFDPEKSDLPDAAMIIINADPGSPEYGRLHKYLVQETWDPDREGVAGEHLLLLHPLEPLLSKTRYAAIATTRVPTKSGGCLGPDRRMAMLLLGKAKGVGINRLQPDVDPLFDLLAQKNIPIAKKDVAALTIFNTMDVRRDTLYIFDKVRRETAANPPDYVPGSLTWSYPQKTGIGVQINGKIQVPTYRNPETGLLALDGSGNPVQNTTTEIEFAVRYPKDVPPPYRMFVYHHGLAGKWGEFGGVSERLAQESILAGKEGWATAAISTIHHGERCTTEPRCKPADCKSCGEGTTADAMAIFHFFAIDGKNFNMEFARENFRQDYIDWLYFIRFLTRPQGLDFLPEGAPDGVPEVKVEHVGYTGLSLGGCMGGGIVPLVSEIEVGQINVGGGGLTDILLNSTIFGSFILLLKPQGSSSFDIDYFFPIIQTIFDPADPVNYAIGMFHEPFAEIGAKAKPVIFEMVEGDLFVPNYTNEMLGRAARTVQVGKQYHDVPGMEAGPPIPVSANLPSGLTTGYFQFKESCTEDGSKNFLNFNHGDMLNSPNGAVQWRHWFRTFYDTGTAEILDPYEQPPFAGKCRQ